MHSLSLPSDKQTESGRIFCPEYSEVDFAPGTQTDGWQLAPTQRETAKASCLGNAACRGHNASSRSVTHRHQRLKSPHLQNACISLPSACAVSAAHGHSQGQLQFAERVRALTRRSLEARHHRPPPGLDSVTRSARGVVHTYKSTTVPQS